jgi:hypothetical protein
MTNWHADFTHINAWRHISHRRRMKCDPPFSSE